MSIVSAFRLFACGAVTMFAFAAIACGDNSRGKSPLDGAAMGDDAPAVERCVPEITAIECPTSPAGEINLYGIDYTGQVPQCEPRDISGWRLRVERVEVAKGIRIYGKQQYVTRLFFRSSGESPCGYALHLDIPDDVLQIEGEVIFHHRWTQRSDDDASETWTIRQATTNRLLFGTSLATRPEVFDQDLLPEVTLMVGASSCPYDTEHDAPTAVRVADNCAGKSTDTLCCTIDGQDTKVRLQSASVSEIGTSPLVNFAIQAIDATQSGEAALASRLSRGVSR